MLSEANREGQKQVKVRERESNTYRWSRIGKYCYSKGKKREREGEESEIKEREYIDGQELVNIVIVKE